MRKIIILGFIFIYSALIRIFSIEPNHSSKKIEVWLSSNNTIYNQIINNIQINSPLPLVLKYYSTNVTKEDAVIDDETFAYITLGLPATQYVQEWNKEKPILYTMVYAPKVHHLDQLNTCGFGIDISMAEYVDTMKQIQPSLKRIYSIHSDPSGKFLSGEGNYLEGHFSIVYNPLEVKKNDNLEEVFNKLQGGDALFLPPDSYFTPKIFSQISKFSRDNGIILATPFQGFTEEGATFSIHPYYSKIGTAIGEKIQRLWESKEECKYGIITPPKDNFLFLNTNFSQESKIILPSNIIQRAESDQLLLSAMALYENNKLKSAEIVLQTILKTDPDNKKAYQLFNVIRKKRTAEHIEKLLKKGNEYLSQKKYQQAQTTFGEVLKIIPNNIEAKQGLLNIIQAKSEDAFQEGEIFLKKKEIFKSLKNYLEAVSIGDHLLAKQRIASIREKEKAKIPGIFQMAKNYYQQRKYKEAILELEKILLIDPKDNIAHDYLKLSKQKLFAIQEMEKCQSSKNKDCRLLWK